MQQLKMTVRCPSEYLYKLLCTHDTNHKFVTMKCLTALLALLCLSVATAGKMEHPNINFFKFPQHPNVVNECASKASGLHFAGSGPISPSRELLLLLLLPRYPIHMYTFFHHDIKKHTYRFLRELRLAIEFCRIPLPTPNRFPFLELTVCYYSSWSVYRPGGGYFDIDYIDPHICTHIVYAFTALSNETWGVEVRDEPMH